MRLAKAERLVRVSSNQSASFMGVSNSTAENSAQPNFQGNGLSPVNGSFQTRGMPKRGPHRPAVEKPKPVLTAPIFLKEWRIFRTMTVEELAVAAKMSTGNISAIENRRQGYSHDGLNKLARALKTTTGALLSVNPLEANTKDFLANLGAPRSQ